MCDPQVLVRADECGPDGLICTAVAVPASTTGELLAGHGRVGAHLLSIVIAGMVLGCGLWVIGTRSAAVPSPALVRKCPSTTLVALPAPAPHRHD